MPRPRKWDSPEEARHTQNQLRKRLRAEHAVEFRAVDGEGSGRWRDHKYVLLGVGDNQVANPDGLTWDEICNHLYDDYLEHPEAAYAGFYLGYDFTQWIRRLPENRARVLLTEQGRIQRARKSHAELGPFPVRYNQWEFDILGFKRFKLRRNGCKGWLYISDAGPFFQASLLKVLDPRSWNDPVVTEEEYAILLEGKSKRDSAILDSGMRRYNALENEILSRLLGRLNSGFVSAGIRLKKNQWFGPGQCAQAWLSTTRVPATEDLREMPGMPRRLDVGRLTYFGGWFEIFAHGHIPGPSYEYDINSAYPAVASTLPCLLHGRWSSGTGVPGKLRGNAVRCVRATVGGSDRSLGAMLHRTSTGSILRPNNTRGWFWQAEIDAGIRCGAISNVEYDEWIEYEPCDCAPPLAGLLELYDDRIRVGKNSSAGKALKLVYNSVYGKLAQSVGNPRYGNAVYASLITSGCRTRILDAIATHPSGSGDLLMVATDGVYFRSPHNALPTSQKIGEWDASEKENLTLFKPGVYWDDSTRRNLRNGQSATFKARGISAKEFAQHIGEIDDHFSRWGDRFPEERDPNGNREGWYPRITYRSSFSMITCQQALQRHKWFLAGAVNEAELIQDADPIGKRHSGYFRDGVYWSVPFADLSPFESLPYDKTFGQPDPEEYGLTDDGTVLDTWRGLLL
jgi:hypothetical protein